MRWLKQLILIIVSIPGIAGCNDDIIHNRITKADELLDDYPDSAIICLKELHPCDIKTRQDKALYSVVSTMANLKLGNDTIEDELLTDAWDYYAYRDEPSREVMLAHFANAALLSKVGNDIEALTEYEQTIKHASGKNADRYRALAYFNMSSIYNEAYSYLDERECIEKGKKYMLAANDTSTIIHGYLVSGMSYNCVGSHTKAMEELEKALSFAVQSRDNHMADNVRVQIAYTNSLLNNYSAAVGMFDSLIQYSDCQLSEVEIYTYVNSLSFSGKAEKADSVLNSLDSAFIASTKPYWIFSQSVIASERGNYKDAYELLNGTMDYQNALVNDKLNSSLVSEQKKLAVANEKIQRNLAENRKKTLILMSLLVILAAAGVGILIAFIMKRHKLISVEAQYRHRLEVAEMKSKITELTVKSRETERVNAAIATNLAEVEKLLDVKEEQRLSIANERDTLRKSLDDYNNMVNSLRQQLISNFKLLHNDNSHFCNNVPDGLSTPAAIKVYEAQRKNILTKYGDEKVLVLLEEQINELMNQILSRLRHKGVFGEEELKIIIYSFCGFNYKSMADLFGITTNNMAVKRFRLKKKINQNNLCKDDLSILKRNTGIWNG